jgi:hypothetical protein
MGVNYLFMGKQYPFIILFLLISSFSLWMEDARVQPKGTLQLSLTDLILSSSQVYDPWGELENRTSTFYNNLGSSLEMGITDNFTALLNWTPGINLYAQLNENNIPDELKGRIKYDGLADLNGGIKYQVRNNSLMRIALGLGLSVPLDHLDSEQETAAFLSGDDFRLTSQNKAEFLGIWTEIFWDINFNKTIFLNFYNRIYYNLPHTDNYKLSVIDFLTIYYAVLDGGGTPAQAEAQAKANLDQAVVHYYAPEIDLEIDLRFHKTLSNKSGVEFSIPLHYRYTPETQLDSYWSDRLSGYIYTLNPSLSFTTYRYSIPFELGMLFSFPLWGVNKVQSPLIALQAKLFLDFY